MQSALLPLLVLTAITVIHCTEEHRLDEHLLPVTSLNKDTMNFFPPVDGAQFGKNGRWFFKALQVKGGRCYGKCIVGEPAFFQAPSFLIEYWAKTGAVRNQ